MAANDLAMRLDSLEGRLAALERMIGSMTRSDEGEHNGSPLRRNEAAPLPEPIQPWKLDSEELVALTDELYGEVKADPAAAFRFEQAGSGSYLGPHARNVARMGMFIADRHRFSEASVRAIGLCALLHDAGMDALPHEFIAQGRPLTPEEYRQVRLHPAAGAEYVRDHFRFHGLLDTVIPAAIEQHHERSDGSGYPAGLAGERIHDFARVLSIADSFEAMTTPRPFRKPLSQPEAMRSLLVQGWRSAGGGMYDHGLLKTLVFAASLYPPGSSVRLGDGRRARVVAATSDPRRPVVKAASADGSEETIDLTRHPDVAIGRGGP